MSEISYEVVDGVATLTLNAPERRNSLNVEMVDEMQAAFDNLEKRDDVGAIVVTGAPPAFCAGATLSHLGSSSDRSSGDDRRPGLRAIYEGFLRVGRCPLPTLAAINGAAVGAGVNLALVCDVRLAARSARLDTRFLQLGLHPGGGHTWMLQRVAGPEAAAATVLFGQVLDGDAAERCRLVWRAVDDDQLLAEAQAMAARAAAAPRGLTRRVKQTLAVMPGVADHDAAVEVELDAQLWSMDQPEFAERLAALQNRISTKP
jgi:enoyl-CoA hydratase